MTCESVQQTFPALVGGDLRPATEAEVRGHLATCAGCRESVAPFERTASALSVIAQREVTPPAGLVDDILEAIHAPATRRLIPLPPVVAGDLARLVAEHRETLASAAGAVAAAAVAGGAIWALWRGAKRRPSPRTATS